MFYQAVVAAVLLNGSESWVVSAFDLRALEGFHVEAARRLTGMRPKKRGDSWIYPKSADVLRAARLRTIGDYIARRRQTVLQAIADWPILEECRGAERRRGSPIRTPALLQNGPVRDCLKDGLAASGDAFPDRPEAPKYSPPFWVGYTSVLTLSDL